MNENLKKITMGGSAIALAIAMGLQTFIFGQSDMQKLKDDVAKLSERVTKIETPHTDD